MHKSLLSYTEWAWSHPSHIISNMMTSQAVRRVQSWSNSAKARPGLQSVSWNVMRWKGVSFWQQSDQYYITSMTWSGHRTTIVWKHRPKQNPWCLPLFSWPVTGTPIHSRWNCMSCSFNLQFDLKGSQGLPRFCGWSWHSDRTNGQPHHRNELYGSQGSNIIYIVAKFSE